MSLFDWIAIAETLAVDGVELYPGFFPTYDQAYLKAVRDALKQHHLSMPMLCASPDFTLPDAQERRAEVERYKRMIDLVAFFDAPEPRTCRLLSGQGRPAVSEDDGVAMVVECIEQVLPYAEEHNVVLALENHYKDNYWSYPEFAMPFRIFRRIVNAIDSPWFGVNFDPSNALLAGEDPLRVLQAVKTRVVSMHASDRQLLPGYTLQDLRSQEVGQQGYSHILSHGEVGTGLNDYPALMRVLEEVDFHGWISIEDGVNGLDELSRSVIFLRKALAFNTRT
jgi:sugar phosphate isomerase/epimerase